MMFMDEKWRMALAIRKRRGGRILKKKALI